MPPAPAFGWAGALLPAALLAAWTVSSAFGWSDPHLLPSPLQVGRTAWGVAIGGSLPEALRWTMQRAVLGLVIGGGSGLVIGLLLGQVRWLDRLASPSIHAFRQVALFAWIPLLTLWCGAGEVGKVAFISLAAAMPMLVHAQDGVRTPPVALVEVARVLEVPWWRRLAQVVLPAAAPQLLTGLRLALIYAWLGTLGAEFFFKAAPGIASILIDGRERFHQDEVIVGVLLVACLGWALHRIPSRLGHGRLPWRTAGAAAAR